MASISPCLIIENYLNLFWLLFFVLFQFQIVEHVNGQTQIYNTQFTSQDDWMLFQDLGLLNGVQVVECLGKKIFRGTSNEVIFKTFFLPPHFAFQITFLIFYSCTTDFSITLYVDNQQIDETYLISTQQYCSSISLGLTQQSFSHTNQHYGQTLQIQIIQNSDTNTQFWGITDFTLSIYQCPQQCDSCNGSGECDKWTQLSNYFGEDNIPQIEGWQRNNQPFGNILCCGNFQSYGPFFDYSVIQFNSIISKDHSEIRIRFKFIAILLGSQLLLKVKINNQEQNYSYNPILMDRNLICGNFQTIITIDGIFPHNVPNLVISITVNADDTSPYFGMRDFEIFADEQKIQKELCNDQNIYAFDGCFNLQYDCSEGCSNCIKGQCIECHSNWEYDHQNYNCVPICGDNIIVGFEECDDSNQIPYDGCHQCQFSCPHNCLQCKFGKCITCNPSFQLVNSICIPYCLDLINNENQQQLIECQPKNHNCQIECGNKQCIKCVPGWNLFNFECVPELCHIEDCQFVQEPEPEPPLNQEICGDGIIQGLEECDDSNTIPFDGCFECQYQCKENCIDCIDGVCLLTEEQEESEESQEIVILDCDYGFYLIDQKCLSICGDQIIASDEKCDDDNNEPYDGCFKCQYSCSFYCKNCIEGQCMTCDIGYQLTNNRCQDQCGDGIKSFNEECDDGNTFSLDGCSEECQVENLWNCITDLQERSFCFLYDNPIFKLQFLNVTFNKQFILMTSSQRVKLKENYQNLTQNLKTQIINVNNLNYIISFNFEDEPTFENYQNIKYLFTIELLKQLEVDLIFQVSFDISLVNNYDLEILNKELNLKLKNPIVLTQQQKEGSSKASQFNIMLLIILVVSSIIILLSGNPSDCFEVLDALQYQSYLRFINVVYPENVFIYFQSSEIISIYPFLLKFNLIDLFQLILGQEILESFGKFYYYSINADLLINFQSQICQIISFLLFAIFYYMYVKIYYKKCHTLSQMIDIRLGHSKILEKIAIILYQINSFILGLGKMFSLNGLIIWFLANSWDVLFKIILYIYSKPQNSIRTQLSIPLCIVIMLMLFAISISYTINMAQNHKLRNFKIFRHQGMIVIKKFLFIFFLIKAQDSSIIQCILIALINTIYIGIVIITKLLKDKIELIVVLWFEMPIIFFTLLSIFFHPDFVQNISNNQQIFIGFTQIAILCFGLLSPLIKYGCILINKIQDYIIEKYKNKLAQKQQQQKAIEQIFL